jgi:hypothetical protein
MNWMLIAWLAIGTVQAGEFAKQVKDSPEESIFWTQKKTSKKMAGVAAMVQGSEFEIKPSAIKRLIKAKKENIAVGVLLSGVKEKLLLVKQSPFSYETDSVHYAGIVKGDEESIVSLSIFDGKLTGSISTNGKRYTVDTSGVTVNVLDTTEIKAPDVQDTVVESLAPAIEAAEFPSNPNRPVKVFYDVDYAMYLKYGSNKAALTQFIESNLAAVSALYANDGLTVQAAGIKVWDTQDPYSTLTETSAQNMLNSYRQKAPLVAGAHLMHLLTSRSGMGGIAGLSALCTPTPHAVSSIYTTFQSGAVAYDWNQNVITHEIGHNLSTHHTHKCDWSMNGRPNQAIDGCYQPEGGCLRPTNPVGFKGTIMSYCHLSNQMDLRLGFGEQPLAKMKNFIANAACLGAPSPDTAPPTVSIASPTANQTLVGVGANRTVFFLANANDDVGVTKVEFSLKGPAGLNSMFTDVTYPFGIEFNQKIYTGFLNPNGDYTIQAKAFDLSGKTASTPVVPFKINSAALDVVKPVLTFVTPTEGQVWTSGALAIRLTATDNVGVRQIYGYVNGSYLGVTNGGLFESTLNFGNIPNGSAKFTFYATDADGNFDTKVVNVMVGGTVVDTTKPIASITAPAAASTVSGSVTITASATDNVGVSKVDFFAGGVLVGSDATAPYSVTWNTSAVANGTAQLRVVAYDVAGNFGEASHGVTVNNVVVPAGFNIASFVVGQNKLAPATKREWIDLKLTGLVGNPTFQGRAVVNTAWSSKAGADAVRQANGDWRIFFHNPNTNYEVKAICTACVPVAEKIRAFKSLP